MSEKCTLTFLLIILSVFTVNRAEEHEFTVEIDPAKRECFHHTIQKGKSVEFEYQVIDGGDMDINCHILNPVGRTLFSQMKSAESSYVFDAGEDGDYAFCLDNTFSRFSSKIVFFELLVDSDDDAMDYEDLADEEESLDMKVDDLKASLHKIKDQMERGRHIQNVLRAVELRDRSIAEDNFERVNFWSGVQVFVMISVAITHVLMIRSLFEDRSGGRGATKDMKMRT